MAWHGPRGDCGCCGCVIFSVDDIFTAGGTTEIDGFTVLDRTLPDPPWQLVLSPLFSGQLDSACKIEFRLLQDDDTVFAEWSLQKLATTGVLTEDFYLEWDTITPIEDNRASATPTSPTFVYTDNLFWRHRLVLREFSGHLVGAKTLLGSGGITIVNDTIEDFQEFSSSTPQLADTDANTQRIFHSAGCPLPLGETTLVDNGPFRIACKVTGGAFVVPIILEKIYQEPVSYGDYGYTVEQEELNVDCDFPYACRVTYPSYATPDFELVSASSDVSLNDTEIAHSTSMSCVCSINYRRISEIQSNQTEFGYLPDGTLIYDGADSALPFVYGLGQASLNDAGLVQSNVTSRAVNGPGDTITDWECADTLTFRTGDFPFEVTLTAAAHGSDATKLVVTASFDVWAWTSEDSAAPSTFGAWQSIGPVYPYPNPGTWKTVLPDPYDVPENAFLQWKRIRTLYSKEVDRWLHEPPEIEFTSADMTSSSATERIVTDIYFVENYSPAQSTPSPALTIVELDNTSIAFTVRARTTPRVPHP